MNRLDHSQSIAALTTLPYRFLGFRENAAVRELFPSQSADLRTDGITGILRSGRDHLTLTYGYGLEVEDEVKVSISKVERSHDLAKRLWGRKKLAELRAKPENKHSWSKDAEKLEIVTPRSSFLVLDRIEDYVKNRIPPPASEPLLVSDYNARVRLLSQTPQGAMLTKINRLQNTLQQRARWYEDDYDWLEQTNVYLAATVRTFSPSTSNTSREIVS